MKPLIYLPAFIGGSFSYIMKIGKAEFSVCEFYKRNGVTVFMDNELKHQVKKYFTKHQN